MRIVPIPCLRDNYAYLVIRSGKAAVVDPSEASPVLAAARRQGVELTEIWLTHHHWDHVGGVEKLVAAGSISAVRGSRYDQDHGRIPEQNVALGDGDDFEFENARVDVMAIPGHTLGAIAYLVEGHLFSGDTLFLAGCGRVFEGTMEMMSQSLASLRHLPGDTHVWCGHEYTVNNLRFAKTVEPDNADIDEALRRAEELRRDDDPTVPGTIARELQINPFLRFDEPTVAKGRDPVASFTAIRRAKDAF